MSGLVSTSCRCTDVGPVCRGPGACGENLFTGTGAQTLFTYKGDFRALKALIAAKYNGVEIATPEFTVGEDNTTPEFLAKSPLGKVPALDTPEGSLFESSAIARYVARLRRDTELCGRTFFESGQVDAWVDFSSHQVEVPASLIVFPVLGFVPYKKPADVQAWADLTKALDAMETHLQFRTYFVGEQVTLADISLASALFLPMTLVLDGELRAGYPCLTRWFLTCVNQPAFAAVLGEVNLCAERLFAEGASKEAAPKKAVAAASASSEGGKKKGGKKGGEAKAAETAAAPAPAPAPAPAAKPKKFWEELPPSKMDMDDFKRFYSNAPMGAGGDRDFFAVMPEFWASKYDPEGFSIFFCNYNYNDENKVAFMTSNLVTGFIQRCDEVRKVLFGSMIITGDKAPFQVSGCFMIRGPSIAPLLEANPDAEYYTWTKVDTSDAAMRQKVADYWCSYDTFQGTTVQDSKLFK
jgi:elongation factor 1-gamma